MKKKDLKDLRTKDIKDLKAMAESKADEALKVKIKIVAGQEKNIKSYKNLKLEVAKILTLVREKEIIEKEQMESKK